MWRYLTYWSVLKLLGGIVYLMPAIQDKFCDLLKKFIPKFHHSDGYSGTGLTKNHEKFRNLEGRQRRRRTGTLRRSHC